MEYLVSLFKLFLLKTADLFFGKTQFFITIFGWFLIITGVICLIRPEKAKKRLFNIGFGLFKAQLLLVIIVLMTFLLNIRWHIQWAWLKLLLAACIFITARAYFILRAQGREKIKEKFSQIPAPLLKCYARIQIAIGALMLILRMRFW